MLDFVDWIARRCGGEIRNEGGITEGEQQTVLDVAQTISVIISLAERGDEQDVVTLSTLHGQQGSGMAACDAGGVSMKACCPSSPTPRT